MSLWSIAWQGGTVIGAPVIGAVAGTLGPRYGLLLGAVAAAAIGAVVLTLDRGSAWTRRSGRPFRRRGGQG